MSTLPIPLPEGTPSPQLHQGRPRNVTDRAPVEVLAHIFQFYIEPLDSEATIFNHPCVQPKDVLPLGAVCQRWRMIAWDWPRLWNSLTFRLHSTTTEEMVQLAIEWLGRSGRLSLSIFLREDFEYFETKTSELLIPLADTVSQVLHRCHYLRLSDLMPSVLSHISVVHPIDSPTVLKTLIVECDENLYNITPLLNFGTAAPLVLTIAYIKLDRIVMDWNNLTELVAYCLYLDEILQVLALAPKIVKLHIFMEFHSQDNHNRPVESRSLHCANLRDLYLDTFDPYRRPGSGEIVSTFLRTTTLPSLTTFRVQHSPPFPTLVFLDFVCRSGCTITKLSLNEECISVDDLVMLAKGLPAVTSFSFHLCPDDSHIQLSPLHDLLRVFCLDDQFHDHDDVLFPNLKHISVGSIKPVPWELLPGLKWKYSYWQDGTRSVQRGRPNLESIFAIHDFEDSLYVGSRLEYAEKYHPPENSDSVPEQLIQDWETFYKLWQLTEDVCLTVGIWPDAMASDYAADLFALSYRVLPKFVGEPPEYIRKSWEAKKWPISWTIPKDQQRY
ncbi:hypothetical protein JR316_0000197 [Psilocybe cubensis]|uniref:F-box domain-containing protein n=2 Tax=Psilocybe cubensis TaxID=181762 RepID=A0A8H7Y9G6_PSICU|nr:hypothetical protein JR316_0000197 [Psilocybe cubensis]KAH9486133.1 hypothetical protein JR316_0000197 [Psilocybe cubensis]